MTENQSLQQEPASLQPLHQQMRRQYAARIVVGSIAVFSGVQAISGVVPDTPVLSGLIDSAMFAGFLLVPAFFIPRNPAWKSRPPAVSRVAVKFLDRDNFPRYTGVLWRHRSLLILDGSIRHFAVTRATADAVISPGTGAMVPPKITFAAFGKQETFTVEPTRLWEEGGKKANQELHKMLLDWAASTEPSEVELLPSYPSGSKLSLKRILYPLAAVLAVINAIAAQGGYIPLVLVAATVAIASFAWLIATKTQFENRAGLLRRATALGEVAQTHG